MKIDDILGFGKILPIDKLIDIVCSVTGRVTKSHFERKDIDTKAYEIKKLAEAKAEEMKIISSAIKDNFLLTGGIEYKENNIVISSPKELSSASTSPPTILINPPLEERTKERIDFQEAKKQLNIESVTAYAADQLKGEGPVTDEPLDEDWQTRFFNIAKDISSDEMQALWGRILAGEIKQPKSYSLRTLELLKNINKSEAECFLKFGKLAITSGNTSFVINFKGVNLLEEKYQLTFKERLLLEELGLVSANNLAFEIQSDPEKDSEMPFRIGKTCIILYRKKGTPKHQVSAIFFTKTGQELLQLIESEPEIDYIQLFASKIRIKDVSIKYGAIVEIHNGYMMLSGLTEVPLTDEEIKASKKI